MYKQGDILLVPIPFSDLRSSKRRPVLVLSNDEYNKMTEGSLKVKSSIRADKIYTISKGIVVKKFRSIKQVKIKQVVDKVDMLMENEE